MKLTIISWHRVSSPLPIHIVMVVDVVDPGSIELGVSKCTNSSLFSFGAIFNENTSVPASLWSVGVPPHEGALQSMDVVDS